MKTYILRPHNSVERQKAQARPTSEPPPQPGLSTGRGPALYIGLDVHTESIAVSLAPSDSTEVRRYGLIGGTHEDVLRLAKKLSAVHPGVRLEFWYEAGPHGYPLCRFLCRHGYACHIASPSKIPRKPGERVKTNRRDADALARLSRAGELSAIHVPEPEDEAVRDLLRARWQTAKHQHRARQQLKSFLLRHNLRYAGTKPWTQKHSARAEVLQLIQAVQAQSDFESGSESPRDSGGDGPQVTGNDHGLFARRAAGCGQSAGPKLRLKAEGGTDVGTLNPER